MSEENSKSFIFDTPIARPDGALESVNVRRPVAGELRGVNLLDLAQLDVEALQKVLPRITTPPLTAVEVNNMTPADLMQLGVEVASFLVTKSMKAASPSA